jgi:hypothetical protein
MKKYFLIILLAGLVVSCNDFLSTKPYASASESSAITDYNSATYALTGVYNSFHSYFYYGRDYLVYGDVFTENTILAASNSGRFLAELQWSVTPTTADLQNIWAQGYNAINSANKILVGVDNINATDVQKAQLKGQALALRALAHFDLVRMFGQRYKDNATTLGIPYMDKSIVYDKPARDSISVDYTKIIRDLNNAIPLLNQAASLITGPYYIDQWGAKALLARVYMSQLDYVKAKTTLVDIVTNSGYSLLSNTSFTAAWSNTYNTPKTEFMFVIANRPEDYAATNSLGYIYLQAGYGDLRVSSNLYNLYAATDIRKTAFFIKGTGTQTASNFVNKYPSRAGSSGLSDCPVIRYSDVYLMYAEACANTSDEPTAITYLDLIRKRADPTAVTTAATGQALLDAIALERRKELAFEGQYFFDLKRLGKTINSGYNSSNVMYTTISYPNTKLAMPIPQAEMDANPNMKQNP